jgi:hypothetical protein
MELNDPSEPNKKFEDLLKNVNFSFTVPVGTYKFNQPVETVEQTIARLDNDDAVIEAMTSYPTAERMLTNLFKKEN